MHRLREWGSPQKVLDLMDERQLNGSEICKMAALIALQNQHREVYCPVRAKFKPWFSVNKLRRKYGRAVFCAVQ